MFYKSCIDSFYSITNFLFIVVGHKLYNYVETDELVCFCWPWFWLIKEKQPNCCLFSGFQDYQMWTQRTGTFLPVNRPFSLLVNASFKPLADGEWDCTDVYNNRSLTDILWIIKLLKGNSGIFKPRPYFWHEIRSSTHREQFGESRRPSEDI